MKDNTLGIFSRGPYDLDPDEWEAAKKEAAEFAAAISPWPIASGHGTYRQKRPGLGITILEYQVDCAVEPHAWVVKYIVSAWRTGGENRFG